MLECCFGYLKLIFGSLSGQVLFWTVTAASPEYPDVDAVRADVDAGPDVDDRRVAL